MLTLLFFLGGGSAAAPVVLPVGGHGSELDEILPGGIKWGSGQRQIQVYGLVDPDEDDMQMLIYLLGMLDD